MARVDSELSAGDHFGDYEIVGIVGVGGMGVVHSARDQYGRSVALKVLPRDIGRDPDYRARFERECRIVAALTEPHVIPIHGYGEIDGHMYLDMRLVDAVDLRERLKTGGPLPAPVAVAIVTQLADALDAAHAAGVVHRDVKPANVLLVESTGEVARAEPFAYLIDFGIARSGGLDAEATNGSGLGTLDYMAPERFDGQAWTPEADVYALGGLLHEMLTASKPFPGRDAAALMRAHFHGPRPAPSQVNAHVPAALDAVVARAMAVGVDDRYASAGELAAAARTALAGPTDPPGDDTSPNASRRPGRPSGRHADRPTGIRRGRPRAAALVVAGCVVAALVAAGVILSTGSSPSKSAPTLSSSSPTQSLSLSSEQRAAAAAVGGSATCVAAAVTIAPSPQNESLDAAVRCSPVAGPFTDVYAFHVLAGAIPILESAIAGYATTGALTATDPTVSATRLLGRWGIAQEGGPVLLVLWPDRGVVVAARPANPALPESAFAAAAKSVSWQYGRFGLPPDYGTQAVVKSLTTLVCSQQRREDQIGVEYTRTTGWATCAVPAGNTAVRQVQLQQFDSAASVDKEFTGLRALGYASITLPAATVGASAAQCVSLQLAANGGVQLGCRYGPLDPVGSGNVASNVVGYYSLPGTLAAAQAYLAGHSIALATLFEAV